MGSDPIYLVAFEDFLRRPVFRASSFSPSVLRRQVLQGLFESKASSIQVIPEVQGSGDARMKNHL